MNIAEFEKYLRMNPSELKQLNTRLRTSRILVNLRKIAIIVFLIVLVILSISALEQQKATSSYTSDTMVPVLSADDNVNSRIITQAAKDNPILSELFQLLRIKDSELSNLESTKLCLNCGQQLAVISQNPISQTGQAAPIFTYKKKLYKKPIDLNFNLWDVSTNVIKLTDDIYIEKSSGIVIATDVEQQSVGISQTINNTDKQLLLYLNSADSSIVSIRYQLTDQNNKIISEQQDVSINDEKPFEKIDLKEIQTNYFCVRTIVQTVEQKTTTNKNCYQLEDNNFKKIVKKSKININTPSELNDNDNIIIKNQSADEVNLDLHDALDYLSLDAIAKSTGYDKQLGLITIPAINISTEPITLGSKKQKNISRRSLLTTDNDCIASVYNTDDGLQNDVKVVCSPLQKVFELSLYSSSNTTSMIIFGLILVGGLQIVGLREELYRRKRLELLRLEYKGKQL